MSHGPAFPSVLLEHNNAYLLSTCGFALLCELVRSAGCAVCAPVVHYEYFVAGLVVIF